MADAEREEMRVAFLEKIAEGKGERDYTQVQSDANFADLVSVLEDWDKLTGAQRKERTTSIYGEANISKGYKLASKYRLLYVNGVAHIVEKFGKESGVPPALGGAEGEGEPVPAVDVRRLVPEGDLFKVLWDTHVDAGGHCKARTFDERVRTRFVGIPRCLHAAPSHPTSSYTLLPHPTLVPSHLTAPFHPTPTPLPSHYNPSPLPLPVPPTPILYCSRWVLAAFVACCVQCMRRVSAKPKSLAGSQPILVRGFNTRGQVTDHGPLPQQELLCVACSPGAAARRSPRRAEVDLVEPIAVDLFEPHSTSGSGGVIAMQRDPFSGAWMNVDLRNLW